MRTLSHPPSHTPAKPVQLLPGAVYESPLGRRCRLCVREGENRRTLNALLLYDTADGQPGQNEWRDGFMLSRHNWHILRLVAEPGVRA